MQPASENGPHLTPSSHALLPPKPRSWLCRSSTVRGRHAAQLGGSLASLQPLSSKLASWLRAPLGVPVRQSGFLHLTLQRTASDVSAGSWPSSNDM
jgi:hypothetical protein